MFRLNRTEWPAYVALAVIVAAGLVLRLQNIGHGLPFVYHPDEANHFTSLAIKMLAQGGLDPGYYENPSGFTYLVYGILRIGHGGGFLFRDVGGLLDEFAKDPSSVFLTARYLATGLCIAAVLGVFLIGRRLWGAAEGVAAAAVLCLAFLPVAYSRYALTDTGVLLPVVVAVYAAIRVHEDGRLRYFVVAGVAVGLAVGFKYTAGLVGAPLLVATLLQARAHRKALAYFGLSVAIGAAVFAVTTPYFFIDLPEAIAQLDHQSYAASEAKLGQGEVSPVPFYFGTLTWGLGWAAALAAAGGAVLQFRQDRMRGLLLAVFPVLLFLYLCTAGRYFARWLMPVYPILALLAGLALVWLSARVSRRPVVRAGVLGVALLAVLAQPILADVRTARLLGRTDTRELARDHLLRTLPKKARVVVEPAVPARYFGGRLVLGFRAPPKTIVEGGSPRRFILALEPQSIDRYRRAGYCTVVTLSAIVDRARQDRVAPALAYYDRLERESQLVFSADPYHDGAERPRFSFDTSTHLYYERAYDRPGPEVRVYRLNDCKQGVGGPPPRHPARPEVLEAERRRLAEH